MYKKLISILKDQKARLSKLVKRILMSVLSKSSIGYLGECFALLWYQALFYKIIARRYKSKLGEIDAILVKGENIVFLEVKTRLTKFDMETCISYKQKQRIKTSAICFLQYNLQYRNYNPRIDLCIVRIGKPIIINNAWN